MVPKKGGSLVIKTVGHVLRWTLAALLFSAPMEAQVQLDLPPTEVFELLRDELSGQLAKNHVIEITRFHRIQGSRGYSEAAQYVLTTLRDFGFQEDRAWIESFPADGKVVYQTWQSPSGWDIESAELRMIQPSDELLVRYPEIGMSVITYSNAGQARAELVDVEAGTADSDYDGIDVTGKFVLATGDGGDVHRLAVLKYGAAAVVCYLDDSRAPEHPDMIGYTGMWPRTEEIPKVTFGFNISNRQGRHLKSLLEEDKKVVLDGKVVGRGLEPWRMEVIVALIPGGENADQELVFTAHLDHPKESANDNASGSAALLDMARALDNLIRLGKLPRPKRTIRFLWVPQLYGTMAYLDSHSELRGPRLGGNVLANLNLDMVGENLDLLHSRMNITWTPPTISSALTDLTSVIAERVDRQEITSPGGSSSNFNYRITPFSPGSDHVIFNDGAVGVPAMMLGHWPDHTHHTTEDTPDKVDPLELERAELIATSVFWTLATVTQYPSLDLANLVAANAQARLIQDTRKAVSWILASPIEVLEITYHDAKRIIDFGLDRETLALRSVLDFAPFELTRRLVDTWTQSLEGQAELQRRTLHAIFYQRAGRLPIPTILSEPERQASKVIPRRLTRGPFAEGVPELLLSEEARGWYSTAEVSRLDLYLLVNLIDGKRSILQIRNHLSAATQPVSLRSVERFIRDLEKAKLVELQQVE